MPIPTFAVVSVLSGSQVSSAFNLSPDRPWILWCASAAGNQISVDFGTSSGGAGEISFSEYRTLAGNSFIINSGGRLPAAGIIEFPPSPWSRVRMGQSVLSTISLSIYRRR
jgi:hypothetical protein